MIPITYVSSNHIGYIKRFIHMLKDLATLRSWDLLYRHPSTGKSIFLGDVRAAQNLNFIHA